jgi:DNA repair protein RecN (Recombination protein N)
MLRHLRITNFAILSDVAIDFAPGFNVLTGETGAGKSLIMDAVALLRGARASSNIPRAGADEAVVEAVFDPPADLATEVNARLEAAGLATADEIVVRRVISRGGRSRVHVNGGLTPVAALGKLGEVLVDLAGQHEHQGLIDTSRHVEILDAFGVDPALSARAEAIGEELGKAVSALSGREDDARRRAEREDFLRYQLTEIDGAKLQPDEDKLLAAERERLKATGRLAHVARRGENELYAGEGAVTDVLAGLVRELEPLAVIDERLAAPLAQIREAQTLTEDAATALRRYAGTVADDPNRLAEIEDRLHLISRLLRKHGASVADVLAKANELRAELTSLEGTEQAIGDLRGRLQGLRLEGAKVARELTAARKDAARRLEKAASEALVELGMGSASVTVVVEPRASEIGDSLGPRGWDRVELLLRANRGEEARPLARIASGGELSRIMLALKLSLRRAEKVGCYVFDEVDAGIGGGTAEVVGRQIRRVADARQVICVTHLAQIAALADCQFRVEKHESDGRTETTVTRLSAAERREEIARMLGGLKITAKTRAVADELLRSRS